MRRRGMYCRAPASDEGRRLHHPVHGSVHSSHRCGEEHGGGSHTARGSHGPCPRIHARHHGGHHAELDWHLLPRVVGLRAPRLHPQGALPEVEAGWAPITLPLLPAARKAQQHFPGVLDRRTSPPGWGLKGRALRSRQDLGRRRLRPVLRPLALILKPHLADKRWDCLSSCNSCRGRGESGRGIGRGIGVSLTCTWRDVTFRCSASCCLNSLPGHFSSAKTRSRRITSSGSSTQREHGARLWRTPSRICCSAAFVLSSMVCPRGGHDADGGQCNSRKNLTRPTQRRCQAARSPPAPAKRRLARQKPGNREFLRMTRCHFPRNGLRCLRWLVIQRVNFPCGRREGERTRPPAVLAGRWLLRADQVSRIGGSVQ